MFTDDGLRVTVDDIIKQNVEAGVDTYVNVNNQYEGGTLLIMRRLVGSLREARSQ